MDNIHHYQKQQQEKQNSKGLSMRILSGNSAISGELTLDGHSSSLCTELFTLFCWQMRPFYHLKVHLIMSIDL